MNWKEKKCNKHSGDFFPVNLLFFFILNLKRDTNAFKNSTGDIKFRKPANINENKEIIDIYREKGGVRED